MKSDMLGRSERAAKEKAVEAAFEYAKTLTTLGMHAINLGKNVPSSYTGPIGDFTLDSIPAEMRELADKRYASGAMIIPLDMLDAIAAMFVTGIADEKTAFPIFGGAFCATIAGQYDIIAGATSDRSFSPFANLIELYQPWSTRLSKMDLARARQTLEKEMSAIPD
ncbi:MAG TPA: hypothetical protein VN956_17480 [Pyrinomonadaceae bacterium]|nr:hypothetical protein [Pyrinomonadaceae bacterium]